MSSATGRNIEGNWWEEGEAYSIFVLFEKRQAYIEPLQGYNIQGGIHFPF